MSQTDRSVRSSSEPSAETEMPAPDDRLARLTPREREVLALIVEGKTNKAIGAALGIAEGTVKSHIRQMMLTMRVKNRTQMALLAIGRF
jgi:two-component system, NarL family, response regulator DevR